LKARGYYDGQDDFECKILLSIRGSVLVEALCNTRVCLTPKEWRILVENELDGTTCEGLMMRFLAKAPDIIQRGRASPQ
jgi:hypothetical protein